MTTTTIQRKVRIGDVVKIRGKYYKARKNIEFSSCIECVFRNWAVCPHSFECVSNIHFVKCTVPKIKPKSKVSSTQKQLEKALCALRVINTWATFHGGRELNPTHVAELTNETLDAIANMQEKDSK